MFLTNLIQRLFVIDFENEEENQQVVLMVTLFLSLFFIGILWFFILLFREKTLVTIHFVLLGIMAVSVLPLVLIKHKNFIEAKILFLSLIWILVTFIAITRVEVKLVVTIWYTAIIFYGGVFLGTKGGKWATIVCFFSTTFLVVAEIPANLIGKLQPFSTVEYILFFASYFLWFFYVLTKVDKNMNYLLEFKNASAKKLELGKKQLEGINQKLKEEIEERTQIAHHLQESQEKYQNIFHFSNDAILIHDQNRKITNVNKQSINLLGYTQEEFLTMNLDSLILPEKLGTLGKIQQQVKENKSRVWHETTLLAKDKSQFPVEIASSLFFTNGKKYIQHSIRDLTAEKKVIEELQERNLMLEALVDISSNLRMTESLDHFILVLLSQIRQTTQAEQAIILMSEPNGENFMVVASEPNLNFSKPIIVPKGQGITGKVATEKTIYYAEDIQADENRFFKDKSQSPSPNLVSSVFYPLLTKNDVIGVVQLGFYKKRSFTKEDDQFFRTLTEITSNALARMIAIDSLEQRVRERTEQFSVINAELAKTARAKDQFLANMSHELRTPLNVILGQNEILQEKIFGDLNQRQERALLMISESGSHLLSLISDILDVAKIEAGKIELEFYQISIGQLTESSLRFVKQMAAEKNISVSCAIDDNVKGIMGDERRLKQVLVNLLTNAVKFTPKGGAVSLCVTGNAEDNIVHFAVSDTGIGIYEDDILELFKPFVQLEGSFSRNYAGTGLGLSLVSKLVELHNGSVRVESEPNKGSTFTISIPWCSERKTVSEDLFKDEVIKPKLLIKKKPTPTILLVEDNEDNIVTMQEFLKFQGFDVVVARNGKECLEHVKKSVPDLIVMDIQMPVMDGLEATKIVRQDHKAAELPIIALTALAMPGDKERCLAAGANKYFSKPVSLNQLLVLIKEFIPVD